MKRLHAAAAVVAVLAAVGAVPSGAESGAESTGVAVDAAADATGDARPGASWAYDLAGELMSPFCPGRTLASCPSPQAGELIQWIATQEAAGVAREEVVRMLVERYGEDILGAPPAKGITLWAWVLPVVGFVAFGAVALLVLRRIVAPSPSASDPGASATAPIESGPSRRDAAADRSPGAGSPKGAPDELARIVDAELEKRA